MSEQRPPIGIMPHDIWVDHRIRELVYAMHRHVQCGPCKRLVDGSCLVVWAQEIVDLNEFYLQRKDAP